MPIAVLLKPNTYRDSVALMVLTGALSALDGVQQASAVMATPANVEILVATGLLTDALAQAGPNDLCVAVDARDDAAASAALTQAEALLAAAGQGSGAGSGGFGGGGPAWRPRTLRSAVQARPDANVALISVPGEHAALEARNALLAGLHVFLFSDHVTLDDEIALKRLATERGLLLMGPDCGTALIAGAPLGFANAVRCGPIGVVGSSGTGLQEVTSLIHRLGGGVSHAIGTGGRDLYGPVGGQTFLAAVDALAADSETTVLVGIAKPGDAGVERRVLERLRASGKPSVVYFLGADGPATSATGADKARPAGPVVGVSGTGLSGMPGPLIAADLEHAARCSVALAAGAQLPAPRDPADAEAMAREIVDAAGPRQRAVCGLFAGGTLAQEAASAIARALGGHLRDAGGTRPGEVLRLAARGGSVGLAYSVLDLGDDAYTRGRPHPLIDPRVRNQELVAQAGTGVFGLFILDVILGTGSHEDPAGALAPALAAARAASEAAGGTLQVIASLCGTEDDSQGYQRQRAALEAQRVRVAASSSAAAAVAARVAALLANEGEAR